MHINGIKVLDAKRPRVIHITEGDIKNATKKDPGACAAAQACMRELHAIEARVHVSKTYLKFNGHWERLSTSKALRDEIIAIDRGGVFNPGKYTLRPARKGHKLGERVKTTNPVKVGKTKRRKARHIVAGVRQHGANR